MTLFGWQGIWPGKRMRGRTPAGTLPGFGRTEARSLMDVPPGNRAKVLSFSPNLAMERKAHLQAYGILPGHWVKVLQHSPVIVIQIDHTEVAMETGLAGEIHVED